MTIFYIGIAVVVVTVLYVVYAYNRLITLSTRIKEAWSDIEVQLKRRYDLIPNLVETVKGYMAHEKNVFENVTKARAMAMGVSGVKEHAGAENILGNALRGLLAVAEAYPQLRASENFQQLHDELTDTENKIQAARRFYNGNVRDLNILIDVFPASLIAKAFRFTKSEFFELQEEAARETPQVSF